MRDQDRQLHQFAILILVRGETGIEQQAQQLSLPEDEIPKLSGSFAVKSNSIERSVWMEIKMKRVNEIRVSDDYRDLAQEVLRLPITDVHVELRRDRVRFNELLARMEEWSGPSLAMGDPTAELGKKVITLEENHRSAVATIKIVSFVASVASALLIIALFIALNDNLYKAVGTTASGALIIIAASSLILAVVGLAATAFRIGRTDLSPALTLCR